MLGIAAGRTRVSAIIRAIRLLTIVLIAARIPSRASADTTLDSQVHAALGRLAHFQSSHSMSDLRAAIAIMYSALDLQELTPQDFERERSVLVSGWATILAQIERSYDPTYVPEPVNTCVIAPGLHTPICNVDPSSINDPSIRKAQADALARNAKNAERYRVYHDLQVSDRMAMSGIRAQMKLIDEAAPSGMPTDSRGLDGILRQAGLSDGRRLQLDALFAGNATPP